MGEPLKGKTIVYRNRVLMYWDGLDKRFKDKTANSVDLDFKSIRNAFHSDEAIKSAVEWLREQLINKMETRFKGKVCYPYLAIGDAIDKAFADLNTDISKKAREE